MQILRVKSMPKWYEYIIISKYNILYQVFNFMISIICLFSSYMYIFMATFRSDPPPYYTVMHNISYVFETLFFIYLILQFFKEYTPEFQMTPCRNIKSIAKNYLETQFKWDLLPLIPL